jgi:hypothetical protein
MLIPGLTPSSNPSAQHTMHHPCQLAIRQLGDTQRPLALRHPHGEVELNRLFRQRKE